MNALTIGRLAKQVNLSTDAIRLYEREGLIEKPHRTTNGYRKYTETTVQRLKFILRAKNMGLTLKEIKELLEIKQSTENTCEEVRHRVEIKLSEIELKISELLKLKKALETVIQICHKEGHADECPLLDALDKPENGV